MPKERNRKGQVRVPLDPNVPEVFVDGPASKPKPKVHETRIRDRKYFFKKLTEKQKDALNMSFPPQAKAIWKLVNPHNEIVEISEKDLYNLIENNKDALQTRQSAWRIFQYYRPKFISYNMLRFE